jgi:hypothetical protein
MLMPAFFKSFWMPTESSIANTGPIVPISRSRLLAAYSIIILFVGGSIIEICRDTEHWPWSCYPMYSYPLQGETFNDLRLYGVTRANTEIDLYDHGEYLQPFDPARLIQGLEKNSLKPDLHNGLLNVLERYELLRRQGRFSGPVLSGIRMYRVYWHLDPLGRNITSPDKMDLILEVKLPEQKL